MLLKKLINNPPNNFKNLKVKGLTLNSNEVKKGFIFFAVKGNKLNGEDFIKTAIKKGAVAIVCSSSCKYKNSNVFILKTSKIREIVSIIASKFYKLKPKNIIAVTGTNGKTSVSDFFYQILSNNRIPVASIGTLGIKFKNKLTKTNLTSPDVISLHKHLEKLKKNKVNNVIIEASSHGLHQNRLNNILFKAGIFTNLSQDHLDYHKTMQKYLKAKLLLFNKLLPKYSYIISNKFNKEFKILKKISKKRKLKVLEKKFNDKELKFIPKFIHNSFQIKNLSMAFLAAKVCGLSNFNIKKSLNKVRNVTGRMELVKQLTNNIKVFVDYAHTPEALEKALETIQKSYKGKINLVFGCGGNRDLKKRPLMAKIAKKFCSKIYVTDDNPRNESPSKIRSEIIRNLDKGTYFNIGNRSAAIKKAMKNAEANEIILVAGKGHENYQDYGNKIFYNTSDRKIIKNIKIKKNKISKQNQNYILNSKIINKIIGDRKFYKVRGLSIDSRTIKPKELFITIVGKKYDGNSFINNAIKKGASYILTFAKGKKNRKKKIIYKKPIIFLNKFAKLKRENSNAKILAITGSAGKTSLKDMLEKILSNNGKTHASLRSFNNHYGVPLSMSNISKEHEFGIFEVGMSKAGEIDKLTKIVKPHIAIITNIAEAHIENFKNIKDIAKAKGEIIDNISKFGTIILNRDDKFYSFFKNKAQKKKLKILSFGKSKKSDVSLISNKKTGASNIITVKIKNSKIKFRINNINVYNVLATLAVLNELNLNMDKNVSIFKNLRSSDGRGKIHLVKRYKKTFKLVDESYNANPLSVRNALESFSKIKKTGFKKYLLLGDMLELGKKSPKYHKDLSKLINRSDIDKVFIKGENTLLTYKYLKEDKCGNIIQCNEDVDMIMKNIIANNDYLMVKGSNATGLNTISKSIIKGN